MAQARRYRADAAAAAVAVGLLLSLAARAASPRAVRCSARGKKAVVYAGEVASLMLFWFVR
jgi:hypothetical protein